MARYLNGRNALVGVFVAGLTVRLAVLPHTSGLDVKIADERHYVELAGSLLDGRGFAWASGGPTSLRPPLYPAVVAATWWVAGEGDLQAVRLLQIMLSALTAALVFLLGRRTFSARVGAVAAAVTWAYPSLVYQNFTLLTETLFTLLVVAFVLLAVATVQDRRPLAALGCGFALGLGALTRSVLWPVPLLLCPLVALMLPHGRGRLVLPVLVLAGYAIVVAPWSVRNTRLQGVFTIVDTMGGLNLRMGNYEHTPEDRMWDAVSLSGEESWVYAFTQELHPQPVTEGIKDKWAQRKAVEYMLANPGTTARRAAIKFGDLWGLERSFIAGVQQGLYSPPRWLTAIATFTIVVTCSGLLLLAGTGLWLTRPGWRMHVILLLPILLSTGVHAIVFGHSRYHLPLVPILALYATNFLQFRPAAISHQPRLALLGAALTTLALTVAWARQVFLTDSSRIWSLIDKVS